MLTEEVEIAVEGLEVGQVIEIELATIEGRYLRRSGRGTFVVGEDGAVRLGRDAPVSGTYEGVDSMGLFWSMEDRNVIWYEAFADEPGLVWPFLANGIEGLL